MEEIRKIISKLWPEWEIEDRIGEGAYGAVYKAVRKDIIGTTYAAIKVVRIPADSNEPETLHAEGLAQNQTLAYYESVVKDYSAEIKLMDSVKGYTNIAAIDDYKIWHPENETLWYICIRMELLTPLVKKLALRGMTEEEIVKLGIDLCTALDICSKHKIVHRDIKPENIFVNENGDYKLGDFGIAKSLERMTEGLSRKGTPNYMAPEIYRATVNEMDFAAAAKVDIYSLGIVLYWLSNGSKMPFLPTEKQIATPEDRKNAFVRRMNGDSLPMPRQVSSALGGIILKACAFEPKDRYGSAAEMRNALQALGKGITKIEPSEKPESRQEQRPDTGAKPAKKSKTRRKNIRRIIVVCGLILAGLIVLMVICPLDGGCTLPPATPEVTETDEAAPPPTPTIAPTDAPTEEPTEAPTEAQTDAPTEEPTEAPTEAPTEEPTKASTEAPTEEPTKAPTDAPTEEPTEAPTEAPTEEPTKASTEAPTEEPTKAPTDAPTEEPRAAWPVYELTGDKTLLKGQDRQQAYYGPDAKIYLSAGAYKPEKVTSAIALFREGDFVLVDMNYSTVGRRCVYFKASGVKDAPEKETTLTSYPVRVAENVQPLFGPGREYDEVSIRKNEDGKAGIIDVVLAAGTEADVFFETHGWVFAQFKCDVGLIRAWLPADYVW